MRLKAENAMAGDRERKDQALAMILEQVERLDALVRRLLSVTERDKLRSEPVALAPFLDSCAAAHADFARARRISLACRAEQEAPRFDPDQMRRALDNLVANALQAAPAGSRVLLAARREGESLVLSVHDDRPGPAVEIRDHMFEPFVTGRPDGTGLGLSIVREVATVHGGAARLGRSGRRNNA